VTIPSGTKLARYEVRSQLGAGGMGEVYLAQDMKLGRKVALKILPADVAANKDRMRRFVQEAKAAAALNHPNIAHIYEIGEADGVRFIAMEFVDGVTLREKIHQERIELTKLLRYLQQVAEGLSKAHASGIVHRDLKPDNIMITRDGYAKILDFGLAKLIEVPATSGPSDDAISEVATTIMNQHSAAGIIIGTVGYMSPEQAQGKTKVIDQRSDIFSFGCILFEAATRHQPFAGDSVIKSLHKVVYEPAPPLTDFNPAAPPDLQRIVRRCLAKDPEERHQSIKDVAIELKELHHQMEGPIGIDGTMPPTGDSKAASPPSDDSAVKQTASTATTQSVSVAAPTSSAEYITSKIKRHKLAAAVAVIAMVLGAVALIAYLHARNPGVAIESIAVLPFQNRSTELDSEYLSDGLAESLIYRLSQLPNLKVSPTSTVFRYKGKDIDPIKVGQELGVSAVLSGRIVQRGDQLTISADLVDVRNNRLLWGEQYDRKLSDLLATQREIAREIVDKLKLKVSGEEKVLAKHYTESNEAYQLYLKGRFYWNKRTVETNKKSIEYFNQAIEKDPSFALAYAGLADCYVIRINPLQPREKMLKAKAAAIRALELDDSLSEAHTSLARVLAVYDWDSKGAEKEFKRAIELNPRNAIAHQWYGGYFEAIGRHNESIAERKRACDLDPLSLSANSELGLAFYFARDYDQAIEQFQKTLELQPNFSLVDAFLPAAFEQKGKYDQAIAGFQNGIALKGSTELSFLMSGLGHVYGVSGKKAEARALLDELKQMSLQEYVPAESIALVYAGLGEKDQAFAWLEKAYGERSFGVAWLKVEPRWDSLRSDPRFADLLRRVGLEL